MKKLIFSRGLYLLLIFIGLYITIPNFLPNKYVSKKIFKFHTLNLGLDLRRFSSLEADMELFFNEHLEIIRDDINKKGVKK